jgi:LacI family transcriptional regulator
MKKFRRNCTASPEVVNRRIMLLGIGTGGLDADIRRGFNRYRALQRLPWLVNDAGHEGRYLNLATKQVPDAILARINDRQTADLVAGIGAPVLDIAGFVAPAPFPILTVDDHVIGTLAADFFLARGFRNFFFVSYGQFPYERTRWEGFSNRLTDSGHAAHWVTTSMHQRVYAIIHTAEGMKPKDEIPIADWFGTLPHPCALFCAVDRLAREICEDCQLYGLHVPEQVSVLGVDNFVLMCESSTPTLSSIRLPGERIGEEAAATIHGMMQGIVPEPRERRLGPVSICERESTDATAVEDPRVAAALTYIRRHAHERIDVNTVLANVRIDRRTLSERFRTVCGRSVLEEIYRVRMELARQHLTDGNRKIADVADSCGYRTVDDFSRRFRQATGMKPSEFRASHRASTWPPKGLP